MEPGSLQNRLGALRTPTPTSLRRGLLQEGHDRGGAAEQAAAADGPRNLVPRRRGPPQSGYSLSGQSRVSERPRPPWTRSSGRSHKVR
jgi:hypothetical protein